MRTMCFDPSAKVTKVSAETTSREVDEDIQS